MSATAKQITPAIKTWQERIADCERMPGLVVYYMQEEIDELRAALAATTKPDRSAP